ncbi:hypothetical protein [Sulfurimonas sp.]|uniref:hypothetical protein n=1 Tax=Sulfurimonas sp. TaxID=2022749 RepID=UPI003564FB55
MAILSSFKHKFFSAFREIFVHHHGSLEFRAKIFALVIASFENKMDDNKEFFKIVKEYGLELYKDEHRAHLLTITTQELVKKVYDNNGLDIDILITNIQKELKIVPRYAKKIDVDALRPLLSFTQDPELLSYQENILEFLENLKNETIKTQQNKIEKSEENIVSKYTSR